MHRLQTQVGWRRYRPSGQERITQIEERIAAAVKHVLHRRAQPQSLGESRSIHMGTMGTGSRSADRLINAQYSTGVKSQA
jgi:hypothetical protein